MKRQQSGKRPLLGRREVLTGLTGLSSIALFPRLLLAKASRPWIDGIDFLSLLQPVSFVARYAAWRHYQKRTASVWISGWKEGRPQTPRQIQRQDRLLRAFGLEDVDVLQYDPSLPGNLEVLRQNYLPVSARPFFLLYENVNSALGEGGFDRDPATGRISLDNPHNRQLLFRHIGQMFRDIIVPEQWRYLVSQGLDPRGRREPKAWIYFWNISVYTGDIQMVFNEIRQRFPVLVVGGNQVLQAPDTNDPPHVRAEKLEWLKSLDILMPYTLYERTFEGTYQEMTIDYFQKVSKWLAAIEEHSPETGFVTTATCGYDDRPLRWQDRSQPPPNPPVIPHSISEVETHLQDLARLWQRGRVLGGPFVVGDEPYEGMAWYECLRHIRDDFVGRTLLRSYHEKYFRTVRPGR